MTKKLTGKQECRFDPWAGKVSWRRKWQPTPAFFPGKSHGQRNLVDYSSWGRKEFDRTSGLNSSSMLYILKSYN